MKVLIIEDEEHNFKRLQRMLKELDETIDILGQTKSISQSVTWLQTHDSPDLMFVDIRLSDGLSFEIFKQVSVRTPIIFTTAFDEYALQAFKFNSVDYLLKPIDADELAFAVNKAKEQMSGGAGKPVDDTIRDMLLYLEKARNDYRRRFLLPFKDGYQTIEVMDIDHVYSENKLTHIALKNKKEILIPQALDDLEKELDPELFFRANRQFLIALSGIGELHNYFNSKLKVRLKNFPDKEVIISREKAPVFKAWLDR